MTRHGSEVEDAVVVEHSASWYWYKRNKNSLLISVAIIFVAIAGMVTYAGFFGTKPSSKAVAATAPVVQKSAPKTTAVVTPAFQTSVGMELRGCGSGDAWLKNTNPCSVLVRYVANAGYGDRTFWMKEIKSGGSLKVPSSNDHFVYGLYIYNMNGGLIGFISGDCPQPPPKK